MPSLAVRIVFAMTEAEDRYQEKRQTFLAGSLEASNAPGWGYFGVPGPLAIGDNSYAPKLTKKPPSDEDEAPRHNVTSRPLAKGAGTDVYFQFETPLALGDPYQDPHMVNRRGKAWMLDPEAAFRPPGAVRKSTNKLGFEYHPHMDTAKDPKEVREKYRDYMPPRQILSNPAKKGGGGVLTGGVLFGHGEDRKFPEHYPDDYDAPKKLRQKELEEHRGKLQEMPFKSNVYGNKQFADNIDTFNYEVPTHIPREKVPADTSRRFPHEAPFKPSHPTKKGVVHGTIGGVPEYYDDPVPGSAVRKPAVEDAPPPYKLGNPRQVTNPMPSVVTNMRNMRNERPASFARPVL